LSQSDRDKWNLRYREGAYATRKRPSAILTHWLARVAVGRTEPRAIDLACGIGRNALYLARQGWRVSAVDVSEVALERLAATAEAEALPITCVQKDLDEPEAGIADLIDQGPYDLAIIIRYANLPLIGALAPALRSGGYLIAEAHLLTDQPVAGPGNSRFRLAPGELSKAAAGLEIIACDEGIIEDPDGRRVALAQLVARKP